MANACIAYDNLADDAMLLASTQQVLAPVDNLQDPDVARRWRSAVSGGYVVADLGASVAIDTVALMGTTMSALGTARVRISSVDSSGAAGDLHDSGAVLVNSTYNQHVALLAAPVTARYVRIDLADAGADYVEAGRLCIGKRASFRRNFAYDWQQGTVDLSIAKRTRGGQTQIWRDQVYRTLDLTFHWLDADERYGFIETIERVNALKDDVLFVIDPDSSNLARDTVWGLMTAVNPIVNPQPDVFSKQYKIDERL